MTVIKENLTVATRFVSHAKMLLAFAARISSVRTRSISPREVVTSTSVI